MGEANLSRRGFLRLFGAAAPAAAIAPTYFFAPKGGWLQQTSHYTYLAGKDALVSRIPIPDQWADYNRSIVIEVDEIILSEMPRYPLMLEPRRIVLRHEITGIDCVETMRRHAEALIDYQRSLRA